MKSKKQIAIELLAKNRTGSREDWLVNIEDALEEYARASLIELRKECCIKATVDYTYGSKSGSGEIESARVDTSSILNINIENFIK